jgi:UDP:flavonoid glycosyltransferase YjiC (YdhE family)
VFVVEESFAGTLEARGFEERLMRLGPPPAEPEVPGQFWKDFIRDTAPEFRKPTIEQLGSFLQPTWQALIDGARYVEPRLAEIFGELEPDVIVEDNVVLFPAIVASGRRWVRIVSCNPAEIRDPAVPPVFPAIPPPIALAGPSLKPSASGRIDRCGPNSTPSCGIEPAMACRTSSSWPNRRT